MRASPLPAQAMLLPPRAGRTRRGIAGLRPRARPRPGGGGAPPPRGGANGGGPGGAPPRGGAGGGGAATIPPAPQGDRAEPRPPLRRPPPPDRVVATEPRSEPREVELVPVQQR